ncbi:hypothetical protein [Schaalia sp. lx-260]|uniref:hypothetical protein n=1 Tax=Schaalia sp. lx-260 TaxID=2899082 RepID=UPI001E45B150|nr:hypothetical protein [Schaalia sp. lx-260]MCD4549520.1 hypothetical protein [Schaalia sp. lx-260]
MFRGLAEKWNSFAEKHVTSSQFIVFFILSNGVTLLQLILMPVFKWVFGKTALVDTAFQFLPIGMSNGVVVYMFDYAAGPVTPEGFGGGLAYFLAVQITLLIAQVINFFAQRNITFKSNSSVWKAAMWYAIAYVAITILAAALQVVYKAPIYSFFQSSFGMGMGQVIADVLTMIINSAISFWVFFPIFKVIFRQVPEESAEKIKTPVVTADSMSS